MLDSSIAINLAAQAASTNGGGVVFVPPGTYAIQGTIVLPANVQLVGSDQGSTSIKAMLGLVWDINAIPTTLTTVMVTNSSNVPGAPPPTSFELDIEVRDITFNGNAPVLNTELPLGTEGAIIEFGGVVGATIQRCTIYNCYNDAISVGSGKNSAQVGGVKILDNTIDVMATPGTTSPLVNPTGNISLRVNGYYNVVIRNNVIGYNAPLSWPQYWGNDGMEIFYCSDVTVSGNQIQLVTDGIDCQQGENCVLTGNIVENFQGFGIRSFRSKDGSSAITHLIIAGNVVSATTGSNSAGPVVSKGCIVADAGLPQPMPPPAPPPPPSLPTSSHFTIANNTLKGPVSGGVLNCGAPNGACTGNLVDLNTLDRTKYPQQVGIFIKNPSVTVRGNEVFDSSPANLTGTGIRLVTDPLNIITTISGAVVDANTVTGTLFGIEVSTNIASVSITDNDLTGNINAIELSSGTITGCRFAGNLGWTPPAISPQPTIGSSATVNTYNYDCQVSVAGSSLSGITVNSQVLQWQPGTVVGPITVRVPVNAKILVTGTSPTWEWIPL
jgi:parallel beta-helix repeat protein